MSFSRRFFIRQVVTIGPIALTLGFETDLWAAQCGLPATGQDCSLPTPPPATRYIPNEPTVRTRYSALEMSQSGMSTQLQQFRDAICAVRDLPPTDVLSWTKLVAQHCINCASTNTSNIHYDQQFLPWHRALLYFLEKSLRTLSRNDDVRLVYWDWENADSRVLPAIYAPPDQPLYWANRNLTSRKWPLKYDDVNVQPLLGIPDFKTFGGGTQQRNPTPAAYSGPHANVHNAFSPGDMANLQYSPRDPVFYAHHGNIDRLWSSWAALPGHSNPDFGDAKVYFYDETRTWKYVLMNDLRDTRKLGYEYSSLMQARTSPRNLRTMTMGAEDNRLELSAPTLRRLAAPGPEFLILTNIRGLEAFPPDTRQFGVFSGRPAVGTSSGSASNFLGMVSRVMSEGHAHAEVLSAALDVSNKFPSLAPGGAAGTFDLFIAPLDDERRTTAEAIPLDADSIRIVG